MCDYRFRYSHGFGFASLNRGETLSRLFDFGRTIVSEQRNATRSLLVPIGRIVSGYS